MCLSVVEETKGGGVKEYTVRKKFVKKDVLKDTEVSYDELTTISKISKE